MSDTSTLAASETRPRSVPDGIFRIYPGNDIYRILSEAEEWSLRQGVVAQVIFWPGVYDLGHGTGRTQQPAFFDFHHIGSIKGFGMKSTRFRRYGQTFLKSLWRYAMQDHSPVIGNFEIENMVETDEPAIILGGQQNAEVSRVFSWGKPADLLRIENTDPVPVPPPGRPFGVWTENLTLKPLIIYGPKKSGVAFRVVNPGAPGCQSFSHLDLKAQITLTKPGSIGINFESHCHVYAGSIFVKGNIDGSANGDATMVNVGPECNLCGNDWRASFIEGVPQLEGDGEILRPAGYRIRVASSARVSGHGKFYRQRESHTPDEIAPGVNYAGEPAGFVKGPNWDNPILADEGI